jgi:hypothetical protein
MIVMKEYQRMLSALLMCLFDLKWVLVKLYWGLYNVIPARILEINLRHTCLEKVMFHGKIEVTR